MTWLSESEHWQSGPWSLERRGDEIADLKYEQVTVLRSVRAIVRDENWGTPPAEIIDIDESADDLTLTLRYRSGEAELRGTLAVHVRASDIRIELEITPRRAFLTNRTGLIVLHDPRAAGSRLEITHSDGTIDHSRFPEAISPHQPAFDIRGLSCDLPNATAELTFEGDIFEMEDQRNWTDASFKTYSRPLSKPFPYRLDSGEKVQQALTIRVKPDTHATRPHQDVGAHRLTLHETGTIFPSIGVGISTAPTLSPTPRLADAEFAMIELDLASSNWQAALERATETNRPLDVRLIVNDGASAQVDEAIKQLQRHKIARIGAFQPDGEAAHVTDQALYQSLTHALETHQLSAPIVGGARSHFTELNREQARIPSELDALTFAITPLFHSGDTEQLIESLAMQRLVAEQAARFAGARPLHIGPITLRPRFNNVSTTPEPGPSRDDLAEGFGAQFTGENDPRQDAPELTAWMLASVAALASAQVESLTYFEEWGPRGVLRDDGTERPVAAAFTVLRAFSGMSLLRCEGSDGLVWAFGGRDTATGDTHLCVINMDDVPRRIELSTLSGSIECEVPPFDYRYMIRPA